MSEIREIKKGSGTKLTKDINSDDLDCKCSHEDCRTTVVDMKHVRKLQRRVSTHWKNIIILDAYKCKRRNEEEGGSSNSYHTKGQATTFIVKGMTPDEVAEDCNNFDAVGRYKDYTYVDSRGHKARWDFRKR